jgi:hypothetical protein
VFCGGGGVLDSRRQRFCGGGRFLGGGAVMRRPWVLSTAAEDYVDVDLGDNFY